jgi:hypothetical protein
MKSEMHNLPEKYSGAHHDWEASFIERVNCAWDDEGYIENLNTGNRKDAQKIFESWLEEHLNVDKNTWAEMDVDTRREAIFNWVETHQPEDWNPVEPPLNHEAVRDERVPATFLSDLHVHVAEEIAAILNKKNPDLPEPLTEDDILPSLEVFTCSNTPADTLYGTDLHFKFHFNDGGDKMMRYYIDITKDAHRKEEKLRYQLNKADYIMSFNLMDEEGGKRHMTQDDIKQKAKEIARFLLKKIDSESHSLLHHN